MKTPQFSIKFRLILFCLLVQIPIFVVLHSAVASTALKNNKAVRGNLISPDQESGKLSQLIHFAYSHETKCLMGNSPPKAEYRVDIACSFGQPIRLDIEVYRANVNFPNVLHHIGPHDWDCKGTNPCKTPWYTQDIDKTQILYVIAQATIRGTNGVPYVDEQKFGSDAPFNNKGVKYPVVQSTRGDMQVVTFPEAPYVKCCTRDGNFKSNLIALYNSRCWPRPPGNSRDIHGHHIKPLDWGGDNSMDNGMLLHSRDHTPFTSWWALKSILKHIPFHYHLHI